jgi:hypothetical protein
MINHESYNLTCDSFRYSALQNGHIESLMPVARSGNAMLFRGDFGPQVHDSWVRTTFHVIHLFLMQFRWLVDKKIFEHRKWPSRIPPDLERLVDCTPFNFETNPQMFLSRNLEIAFPEEELGRDGPSGFRIPDTGGARIKVLQPSILEITCSMPYPAADFNMKQFQNSLLTEEISFSDADDCFDIT